MTDGSVPRGRISGRFGLLDPGIVDVLDDSYVGDLYNQVLAVSLPREEQLPDAGAIPPLLIPEGFARPGGQDYASGAHHHQPLSLHMWDAATQARPVYADGSYRADHLAAIWDGDTNGSPGAFESCGSDVVSVWCMKSQVRAGQRRYAAQHRYRMPVRQLIKGFRCPACTASKIAAAKTAVSNPAIKRVRHWAATMNDFPHTKRDWAADLNYPVPADQAPACRQRFYDMRCSACGLIRINFGDALAVGSSVGPPQGCPKCRRGNTSMIERVVTGTLSRHAKEGVQVLLGGFSEGKPVDALVLSPGRRKIVVEYDGVYWHRDKLVEDTRLTAVQVEGGAEVVRLRPRPLTPVPGALNVEISTTTRADITAAEALEYMVRRYPDLFESAPNDAVRDFAVTEAHSLATSEPQLRHRRSGCGRAL